MSFPDQVNPGQPLKASWANDVVATLKSGGFVSNSKQTGRSFVGNPFDTISLSISGDDWFIKLQPAYYHEYGKDEKTSIIAVDHTEEEINLEDYPLIKIEQDKDLYFCWKDKKLVWDEPDITQNLKVLQFIWDTSSNPASFKITNLHPNHIDVRNYPPFHPLVSKNEFGVYAGVIPGYVVERTMSETDNSIVVHSPKGMLDLEGSIEHYEIYYGEQLACIYTTDERGLIDSDSVEIVIENRDESSLRYFPPHTDDYVGEPGDYHFKLYGYDEPVEAVRGNIPHLHEIPTLKNTLDGYDGRGRFYKQHNREDNEFIFRVIAEKGTNPQINITENDDTVVIEGNGVNGTLSVREGDESPETKAEWIDGLVTTEGDVTVDIPKYMAGENISITGPINNVYTISTDASVNGGNLNLEIYNVNYDNEGKIYSVSTSWQHTLFFRNGLFVGTGDPGSIPDDLITIQFTGVSPAS